MSAPATHGGASVRRIDTHAAAVFLAGERVYKVKRAVKFPFLDFSTVEKRKAACEAELEVNRPFAPKLYRGCRARSRAKPDGRLALDGKGEPVEWAVEMRRFDENATLDRLARARRSIPRSRMRSRARSRRRMRGAPVVEAEPWLDALGDFIAQNDAAFREAPRCFRRARPQPLTQNSRAALDRLQPLLRERGKQGLVRRGHGDLHLGNIALIDGRPVPFDAVEFDPLIAAGDVLYDLAFLLMDLTERGLQRRREHRAQPLSRRDAPRRGPRRARRPAAVHVGARRDPRQGDGGAAGECEADRARRDHQNRRNLFRSRLPPDRAAGAAR